jgi:glutamate racemase
LAAGADHIVLGCTHFSYLKEVMMRIVAGRAVVIDSAQAVARQVEHVLVQSALQAPTGTKGCRIFSTTGNQERFFSFLQNTFSEGDRPFSP